MTTSVTATLAISPNFSNSALRSFSAIGIANVSIKNALIGSAETVNNLPKSHGEIGQNKIGTNKNDDNARCPHAKPRFPDQSTTDGLVSRTDLRTGLRIPPKAARLLAKDQKRCVRWLFLGHSAK